MRIFKSTMIAMCLFTVLTAFTFLAGCSNSVTTPGSNISVSTYRNNTDFTDNALDSIQIDTVKVLIKDVKLKASGSNDSNNVKTGSFVLYLNANAVVNTVAIGSIPEGSYEQVKFEVHKVDGGEVPPDPEFREGAFGDNERYSVIVKGVYHNVPFTYKSKKSAHQKINLNPAVVVGSNNIINLTLSVNPYKWFMDGSGMIIDPTVSANENDIDNNIKDNFKKAFKDNDKNGIPD
jgi:hypothetical protein